MGYSHSSLVDEKLDDQLWFDFPEIGQKVEPSQTHIPTPSPYMFSLSPLIK